MIELKGLSKTYTVSGKIIKAVQPLDLTIQQGEFVSIVGHSGSGKSTFLSLIGGIARPDAGTVSIDGTNIWGYNDKMLSKLRNEKFGFVYQFASLIPTLNATENVLLPTAFGGGIKAADAANLLDLVGLGDKKDRYPSELSGGEQQRVAIARAFVHNPEIVLADEPTGNLDSANGDAVLKLLEELNKEGTTIVMVTHSPAHAERAHRIVQLFDGNIVTEHIRKELDFFGSKDFKITANRIKK